MLAGAHTQGKLQIAYTGIEAVGRKRRGLVAGNGVEPVRLPAKIFLKDSMLY
jgi:hypothetical protein